MKILHTADWHIGKLVHNLHMTQDQQHILKELTALIVKERPDVLIIAGDIYDRAVPPTEAVDLLDETLTEIVMTHGVKVMAIAGNHDSPDRLGFASRMLSGHGLHIQGLMTREIEPITLTDEHGPVDFWLVPYAEPAVVRELLGDESIRSHDQAMKAVIGRIHEKRNKDRRNVCLAHAYLMGTDSEEVSDSVRPLSIGGSEFVDWTCFEDFDYVALGHLHRPQRVKKDHIRYAGSLMKYSFSEALQHKSVTMAELKEDGTLALTFHELTPGRDMRIIKGHLENLVDEAVYGHTDTEDYIMAVLTDEGELIDPMNSLRAVYPNVLRVEKEVYGRRAGEDRSSAGNDFRQKNPLELFGEFYENIGGDNFDEEGYELVGQVIDGLMQKGRMS